MADLTPILPRIRPLLGKLGSDHEPEALAAIRALKRTLAAEGLSLNDLGAALAAAPAGDPAEAERERWWGELRGLAERKAYRPGWVAFSFEARFPDADPPHPEPPARMPSPEVRRWVRARASRWARAKQRGAR